MTVAIAPTMSPTSASPASRPKTPTAIRDATDELRRAVDDREESRGLEVLGLEVHRLAVNATLVERAKERARAVIDEQPREQAAHDEQRDVASERRVASVTHPVRRRAQLTDGAHHGPSVAARTLNG